MQNLLSLRIREIRETKKLSKEYVATQMEISINDYNKIEIGKVDLKLSKLNKLVKILGTKKSELFTF
jgi:transcriptional regulator with XRE-family HTH domain